MKINDQHTQNQQKLILRSLSIVCSNDAELGCFAIYQRDNG